MTAWAAIVDVVRVPELRLRFTFPAARRCEVALSPESARQLAAMLLISAEEAERGESDG